MFTHGRYKAISGYTLIKASEISIVLPLHGSTVHNCTKPQQQDDFFLTESEKIQQIDSKTLSKSKLRRSEDFFF